MKEKVLLCDNERVGIWTKEVKQQEKQREEDGFG